MHGHWNAGGEWAAGQRTTFSSFDLPTIQTTLLSPQEIEASRMRQSEIRREQSRQCVEIIFRKTPDTLTADDYHRFHSVTSESVLTGARLNAILKNIQHSPKQEERQGWDTDALEMVVRLKTGCSPIDAAAVIERARAIDPKRRKEYIIKVLATGAAGAAATASAASLSVKTGVLAAVQVKAALASGTTIGQLFGFGLAASTGIGALALGSVAIAAAIGTKTAYNALGEQYADVVMTEREQDRKILNYLLGGTYERLVQA